MEELLTAQEVADYLKMSRATVNNWRYANPRRGPEFIKLGGDGDVRYPKGKFEEWLKSSQKETLVKQEKEKEAE
jgi:predicted DNA-binding transcriptional regulator AlpA